MERLDGHSIFENVNILPAQFFPKRADRARMEPLKRLAFAVLLDAIRVFQSNFGSLRMKNRREFYEACEWLLSARVDGLFSFENVCYLVDIDAVQLRQWLKTWPAKERAILAGRQPLSRSSTSRPGTHRIRMKVNGSRGKCTSPVRRS